MTHITDQHEFVDGITRKTFTLQIGPNRATTGVRHDECARLAEVSPELDSAFCTRCNWQCRISGAWFVDLWEQARARPVDTESLIGRAFDIAESDYPDQRNESGEREDARWYAMLRALIIEAFNPPDDDVAECCLLADSVAHAFAFIVAVPCTCEDTEQDGDPCDRCQVLGRINDEPIER